MIQLHHKDSNQPHSPKRHSPIRLLYNSALRLKFFARETQSRPPLDRPPDYNHRHQTKRQQPCLHCIFQRPDIRPLRRRATNKHNHRRPHPKAQQSHARFPSHNLPHSTRHSHRAHTHRPTRYLRHLRRASHLRRLLPLRFKLDFPLPILLPLPPLPTPGTRPRF